MLKLFKYNWKKSDLLFYSIFGLNTLLFVVLLLVGRKDGWWDEVIIGIAFSISSTLMQVLLIVTIYNFNAGLKSVTRRLLPISEFKEYIAHILVPFIYNIAFVVSIWAFLVLLKPKFQIEEINVFLSQLNIVEVSLSLAIISIFYTIMSLSMYYFCVAFARMFKTNLRILIFILSIFVMTVLYAIGNELVQRDASVLNLGNIYAETSDSGSISIEWFVFNWVQVVELVLIVAMVYATVYIMKKKIEV